MKVNILEAHDRLLEFRKQSDYISEGCMDCIRKRPEEFGSHPFYILAHKREIATDERIAVFNQACQESIISGSPRIYKNLAEVPTHRLIWSPRLTKPKAQENSMLFKYYPSVDQIRIIWIIPDKELWEQYIKDNLTENQIVCESIHDYKNNKNRLEASESDDLSEDRAKAIYTQIAFNANNKKLMGRLYH